ncbi:MAG: ribonuclease P protein component [Ardenticatenaceae bacterium]|nr:ribonuclease P protein component [Ardenticatenaceae bacterium]
MLQPQYRLRRSADLRRVREQGRSRRHPLVVLIIQPNGLEVSRFAFVASRRVGNAVQRNRARRLLREVIRGHLMEVKPGWDCLLIARQEMRDATLGAVETAVLALLARLQVYPALQDDDVLQDTGLL